MELKTIGIQFLLILVTNCSAVKFPDWLITKIGVESQLRIINNGQAIQLTNGLISRTFRDHP